MMTANWCMEEFVDDDYTHLVLNDIQLKYYREALGCQEGFHAKKAKACIKFLKPVLWTRTKTNDPRNMRAVGERIREIGPVVVDTREKIYGKDAR